jgi:glucose-1-phosphate adenylyltransferase
MNTLAVIIAGCQRMRLDGLSTDRAEAALPFGGKYRVIDFVLSNCANSGLHNVGILTQYHTHELCHYIGTGQPWDLDRRWSGGITVLMPYQRNGRFLNWYRGTADAVYKNLDFIIEQEVDTVLVLPGEQIYKMDYTWLLRHHQQHQADVTICVIDAPRAQTSQSDFVIADDEGRVRALSHGPHQSRGLLASTGIYVFQTDVLIQRLGQDASLLDSLHDFGRDVLPRMLELGDQIFACPFDGYWVNLDTVETFWNANMGLLQTNAPLNLQDRNWSIYTRSEERPPVSIMAGAGVSNSLISDGCTIQGHVENSVLSSGVHVRPGAIVRDAVIFDDCEIGADAIVERAILDRNVQIGDHAYIGCESAATSLSSAGDSLDPGLTVVAQDTRLPTGARLQPNQAVREEPTEDPVFRKAIAAPNWVESTTTEAIPEPVLSTHI